jgi:hypothetical protein
VLICGVSSGLDVRLLFSEPQHVRTSFVTGKSPRLPVCRHVGSATETQRHRV